MDVAYEQSTPSDEGQRLKGIERFQHLPLDKSKNEIRLLHVHVNDAVEVRFSIEHYELSSAPAFRALSYVWGPEDDGYYILIKGRALRIRRNLHEFLQQFCQQPREEYLWIDQITIDQENIAERNHQVSLMSEIYPSAWQVIIWIPFRGIYNHGELEFPEQCRLVASCVCVQTFIWWPCQFCRKTLQGRNLNCWDCIFLNTWFPCQWKAELCYNEYWTRTWIISETVLAREIQIQYGRNTLHWDYLDKVRESDSCQFSFTIEYAVGDFCWIKDHAMSRNNVLASSKIRDLLVHSSNTTCSDSRDVVYAVQSVLPMSKRLEIDYEKTYEEVLLDVITLLVIEAQKDSMPDPLRSRSSITFNLTLCVRNLSRRLCGAEFDPLDGSDFENMAKRLDSELAELSEKQRNVIRNIDEQRHRLCKELVKELMNRNRTPYHRWFGE